jgi:hypothetical protein
VSQRLAAELPEGMLAFVGKWITQDKIASFYHPDLEETCLVLTVKQLSRMFDAVKAETNE